MNFSKNNWHYINHMPVLNQEILINGTVLDYNGAVLDYNGTVLDYNGTVLDYNGTVLD